MRVTRPHWSYSQIAQYLRCPLQYYFERVLRLSRPFVPSGLAFGSAVHAALAEFHRHRQHGQGVPIDHIQENFRRLWSDAVTEQPIQFRDGETVAKLQDLGVGLLEAYAQQPFPGEVEGKLHCPLIVRPTSEDVVTGHLAQALRVLNPRWWLPDLLNTALGAPRFRRQVFRRFQVTPWKNRPSYPRDLLPWTEGSTQVDLTLTWENPRRNIIVSPDLFGRQVSHNPFKYESHRFGYERSEDAVSWNVWRSLYQAGLLGKIGEKITGIAGRIEPTLYLWGRRFRRIPHFFGGLDPQWSCSLRYRR
jgi:hypothetical protein